MSEKTISYCRLLEQAAEARGVERRRLERTALDLLFTMTNQEAEDAIRIITGSWHPPEDDLSDLVYPHVPVRTPRPPRTDDGLGPMKRPILSHKRAARGRRRRDPAYELIQSLEPGDVLIAITRDIDRFYFSYDPRLAGFLKYLGAHWDDDDKCWWTSDDYETATHVEQFAKDKLRLRVKWL